MLYPFLSVKYAFSFLPVSHLCASAHPGLIPLLCFYLMDSGPLQACCSILGLLPRFPPNIALASCAVWLTCVNTMPGVCSVCNPGKTTYWDKSFVFK